MSYVLRFSFLVLTLSFVALWLSVGIGVFFRKRRRSLEENEREDFGSIMTAILTLLGLIIGFSFSMAIYRYDQRKVLEETEANAIGTEYVRADFLPAPNAAKVRTLLREYLDQRLLYYTTRDKQELAQLESATAQLEAELWSAVQVPTAAQPTAPLTITVMGMNDVLNSRGYTQAAWLNRIPNAAWGLMAAIAIFCNVLIGYGARRGGAKTMLLVVLPLVIAISFTLIADIDSPRGGVVRVRAENLTTLARSLHASIPDRP
jgi:amino acid transporter